VALFAVEEALRSGLKDTVRLFNPQSGSRVDARFMAAAEFRERAMGVKTMGMAVTGVPVELAFIDPAGTIGRGLLPTGEAVDRLALGSGVEIEASIVDCGTVYVFVAASDLGLDHATATLSARRQGELLEVAEKLRGQAAVLCGLADRPEDARRITPAVPKIAIVSPPHDYALDAGSQSLEAGDVDMLARIVSSQNLHKAYAVTGAIATIAAAVVPGSVVNRAVGRAAAGSPLALRIGHPGGVNGVGIERTYMIRTARRIMTGSAHVADLVQVHPPVDLRTTRIWTSVPIRNANSAPQASSHRVRVR
jgi:2-methylaconitate cis-trans-isomerase PrpF